MAELHQSDGQIRGACALDCPDTCSWIVTVEGGTFIQRLNTVGGAAPGTGCALSTHVGKKAFVPYAADYLFYEATGQDDRDDN